MTVMLATLSTAHVQVTTYTW